MTSTSSWRGWVATVLAGLLLACGSSASRRSEPLLRVPVDGSPQRGPADAWVTLVEFADFQCPYCRDEEPIVADLATAYGADLRLVFKYLPLSFHDRARPAALAAACADEQGKFWEMHDLLFQGALDDASILADAGQIAGLDVAAWQACLAAAEASASAPAAAAVDADVDLAMNHLGIRGTPTFVVNGVEVVGAVPEQELRDAIDAARARAVASGIPRAEYYRRAVLGQ